jgi:hypothetical protein
VLVAAVCDSLHQLPPSEASSTVLFHVLTSATKLALSAVEVLRIARHKLEWTMGGATQQRDVFQFVFLSLAFLAGALDALRVHHNHLPTSVEEGLRAFYSQLGLWAEEQNSAPVEVHGWIADRVERLRALGAEWKL